MGGCASKDSKTVEEEDGAGIEGCVSSSMVFLARYSSGLWSRAAPHSALTSQPIVVNNSILNRHNFDMEVSIFFLQNFARPANSFLYTFYKLSSHSSDAENFGIRTLSCENWSQFDEGLSMMYFS